MMFHPQKIGVCSAMSRKCLMGSIFFKKVIVEVYHNIIQQFIAFLHEDVLDAVFQQNNGRLHVVKDAMSFFGSEFTSAPPPMAQIWPIGLSSVELF